MATREQSVAEFNVAGGGRTVSQGGDFNIQLVCFSEELAEFNEALANYMNEPSDENRQQLIKEWADVQVTLSNLAWFFEFDGEEAFYRVHKSNMSKVVGGTVFRRADGKILKPDTYQAPDMSGL